MTPLSCGQRLADPVFGAIRRQMVLNHCKWDPQVEDVRSLCQYPLLLSGQAWRKLANWAEELADETLRAEAEVMERPELLGSLGLPRSIRRLLANRTQPSANGVARIMRFDFHWTSDGWKISEVNSDVPGGFIESSAYTDLFQKTTNDLVATGSPSHAYVDSIARSGARTVALVHATSYSDDRQVMIYLASLLRELGVDSCLCSPGDLMWNHGKASVLTQPPHSPVPVDAVIRFFPGEWLPNLRKSTGWTNFFRAGVTPVSNPGAAMISQSKRFPLVWDQLQTQLPLWRSLLPVTRDPRKVPWKSDSQWVLKPALGRVGESIGIAGITSLKDWSRIRLHARWWPSGWAAQQRFELMPIGGPDGDVYPVIGVFTVNRSAVGVYARIARRPLIDYLAQDIAVLVPSDSPVTQRSHDRVPTLEDSPGLGDCQLLNRSTRS